MVGVTSPWDQVQNTHPSGVPFLPPRSYLIKVEGMAKSHHRLEN